MVQIYCYHSHLYTSIPTHTRPHTHVRTHIHSYTCAHVSVHTYTPTSRLRSPVGPMTAHEQHLEGQLRFVNSRVITNSEEISFYQGNVRERLTVYNTFNQLVREKEREEEWERGIEGERT